jgi:hypothetical protein
MGQYVKNIIPHNEIIVHGMFYSFLLILSSEKCLVISKYFNCCRDKQVTGICKSAEKSVLS